MSYKYNGCKTIINRLFTDRPFSSLKYVTTEMWYRGTSVRILDLSILYYWLLIHVFSLFLAKRKPNLRHKCSFLWCTIYFTSPAVALSVRKQYLYYTFESTCYVYSQICICYEAYYKRSISHCLSWTRYRFLCFSAQKSLSHIS